MSEVKKEFSWGDLVWKILSAIPWGEIIGAIFEAFKPKLVEKVADPKSKISDVDIKALEGLNDRLLKK